MFQVYSTVSAGCGQEVYVIVLLTVYISLIKFSTSPLATALN